LNGVGPAGGTIGGSYQLLDVGQESAAEAGWNTLAQNATGSRVQFPPGAWPSTLQVAPGSVFSGATVSLQGSVDGSTWVTLSPPVLTAAGLFNALQPTEIYTWGRPQVNGGGFLTNINVTF
jgi:hypothetical protein